MATSKGSSPPPGAPQVNTDPFPNNGVSSQTPSTRVFLRYTPVQGGIETVLTSGKGITFLHNNASIESFPNATNGKGKGDNIALFPFSPLITSTTFDNSVYNALINNFNENRPNSFLMDVDYLNSPTVPVNQKAIIRGTAKKAQVPDSNYTSKQVITPRYLGSKVISANYNFPTPAGRVGPNTGRFLKPSVLPSFLNGDTGFWQGDSSYGNTAAIDKNPIYFAHFKTSTENENLPGTFTFNVDSLIEAPFDDVLGKNFFPKIIKIDGSNQNLSSTVSTFEVGRKATVSYNNTIANKINFSLLPVGDNIIYQGGLEFDNIIWNLDPTKPTPEANPIMSFENGPTSTNLQRFVGGVSRTFYPASGKTSYNLERKMNITRPLFLNFFGGEAKYNSYNPNGPISYINTPNNFIYNNFRDVYGYILIDRDIPLTGISGKAFTDSTGWLVSGSTNLFTLNGSITSSGVNITGSSNLTPNGVVGESLDGTKTITAGFEFSNTASLQSVSFTSSTGNWNVGETCFFTSQSMGATESGGVGFNLTLIKQNFENNRKGFFSLGGPFLIISSSTGTGGINNPPSSVFGNGPSGNVFQGSALAAIHTINQSVKNQIPFISSTPPFTFPQTKSFGLPNGLKVDPLDPKNYIRYDVNQTILSNRSPGDLITNDFIPRSAVEPGFNLTGSSGFKVKALVPDVNGDVAGNFYFENSQSLSPKEGQQPSFFNPTRQFEIGEVITFSSQSLGATVAGGSDLKINVTKDILENVEENTTLSNYKNTKEPFLIEVGDEIRISYDTIESGATIINNATFEVINVPNNGFDDGDVVGAGSVLVNGKLRLINNLPIQPQNVFYKPNGEPIPGRANLLYETLVPDPTNFFTVTTAYRSSTNCFDRLEVSPNPQDIIPPIPEGKINNFQIIRRTNADDRVIIFQVAPSGSEGVNTPSGPGFIIPNDLTSVQKLNVESLISLLNEKNTFKDEIPSRNEGLTP